MDAPVTVLLIAITALVSWMAFSNEALLRRLWFEIGAILRHNQHYRIVTSAFVHGDMMHLLFNMFTLFFFGGVIERSFGAPIMLAIYFAAVIGGGLLALILHRNEPNYRAVGASGGVSGILFLFVVLAPGELIYIFGIVPLPAWLFGVLYLVITYRGMVTQGDNIGHDAHLGGSLIGVLAGVVLVPKILESSPLLLGAIAAICVVGTLVFYLRQRPASQHKRLDPNQPYARRYDNPGRRKQRDIDRILDKVSNEGYDSLTPSEQRKLDEHAKRENSRR